MLLEGEKFEPLGSGIEVIVSKRHIFWTDTILLANFAKPKNQTLPVTSAVAVELYH